MIIKTENYTIENIAEDKCKISGTMRLPSPLSYDQPFNSISVGIKEQNTCFIIDISELEYLNSSGITALARLVILAKNENQEIKLLMNEEIPWQNRSLRSLSSLWKKLTIINI